MCVRIFFVAMFLHAGVVHFAFNMLGFLQVGTMVEKVFGWWKVRSCPYTLEVEVSVRVSDFRRKSR